jgi:hypothetical protein
MQANSLEPELGRLGRPRLYPLSNRFSNDGRAEVPFPPSPGTGGGWRGVRAGTTGAAISPASTKNRLGRSSS